MRAHEIVPLADRLRYMQMFRLAAAALVATYAILAPHGVPVARGDVARWTGAYLLFSLAGEAVWRLWRKRGITLFGSMIIVDGFYLAWASYATGASASPLRYVIVLHIIAVTLLASYRTGLKLALWHSVLLFVVHDLQDAGLLRRIGEDAIIGSRPERLAAFVAVTWAVAIATATFSAVNERELRRRKFDLEALARMARGLQATTDAAAVADLLLDSLTDAFGFGRALALRLQNGALTVLSARGVESDQPTTTSGVGGVVEAALEGKTTLLVSGLDPTADHDLCTLLPSATNLIIVPLLGERAPIGVVVLEHGAKRGARVERRLLSILEQFLAHAALALRNAWLLQEVKKMALTDGLTLIANRLAFETNLEREIDRASRDGRIVALILLDIDHFKQVNDSHGHQVGDEVLCKVADALALNCRDGDVVARYGGEEFAVILPECGELEAAEVAEQFRGLVAVAETPAPVTVSAGVAVFPAHATDSALLLKAADEALYESKRSGRDRVTISQSCTVSPKGDASVRDRIDA